MIKVEEILNRTIEMILNYGLKLFYAVLVLIIGFYIIKIIRKAFSKFVYNKLQDATLQTFLSSFISILLKIILIITVISMLGIEMTSMVALLGAAGLAIGMAFSGTLQNFAGGIMILFFKPFKVSDTIEVQGYIGTVSAIQIFHTMLTTPDNKVIVIPNGGLSTGSLINYSAQDKRRVDWTFGVAYGTEIEKVKRVVNTILKSDNRILEEPDSLVTISQLAESSVKFTVRAWVKTADYWDVLFYINEQVYEAFNKEGVKIPFPQVDVHMVK